MVNKVLGRGLSSLLREELNTIPDNSSANQVDIDLIKPNPNQPRTHFDEGKIRELADSIISLGVIQPIAVTKISSGKHTIIAGERRYRASKLAGLKKVPVIVRNVDEKEILELALVENIQRADLSAIEEAESYSKLISEYGYSQTDLANSLGKSRSHVANILRLNNLSAKIKSYVNEGRLTMGHARALIGIEDADSLADKIVENDLNVRQTEELVSRRRERELLQDDHDKVKNNKNQDEELVLLGQHLSEKFGVKVTVESSWNGGRIVINYKNADELDSVLQIIQ